MEPELTTFTVTREQRKAERAVIEAAKALYAARQMRYGRKRDNAEEKALFDLDDHTQTLLVREGE